MHSLLRKLRVLHPNIANPNKAGLFEGSFF